MFAYNKEGRKGELLLFKKTKITPGSNLMWESSRMMLPEHVQAFLELKRNWNKKKKPEWDDQRLEEMERVVVEAYASKRPVTVTLFGEWETRCLTGVIARLDPYQRKIRLDTEKGSIWINWTDVLDVDEP
mgnify:CR=1 FL=1